MSSTKRIRDLAGLGPKSEGMLADIGVNTVDDFLSADVFELYRRLALSQHGGNLNMLYAMIGAQQNKHWQAVKQKQRMEILMRLDDMGLAPK